MSPAEASSGTDLESEAIALAGLRELQGAQSREDRSRIIADIVLAVFDHYYYRSRRIPHMAKRAFEQRNWPETAQLSRDRLSIYGRCINGLVPLLRSQWPRVPDEQGFWSEVEARYLAMIRGRYEADLAFAFLRSTRRLTSHGEWTPVAYSASAAAALQSSYGLNISDAFPCGSVVDVDTIITILEMPNFPVRYRDLPGDAALVAAEVNAALARIDTAAGVDPRRMSHRTLVIEMIDAGFFRNRGCYLMGRIATPNGTVVPIAIALLNEKGGIFVDAVLLDTDEVQFVFSSTLANFHVTNEYYHELAGFLQPKAGSKG